MSRSEPAVLSRVYLGEDAFMLVVLANKRVITNNPATGKMEDVGRHDAAQLLREARHGIKRVVRVNPTHQSARSALISQENRNGEKAQHPHA